MVKKVVHKNLDIIHIGERDISDDSIRIKRSQQFSRRDNGNLLHINYVGRYTMLSELPVQVESDTGIAPVSR